MMMHCPQQTMQRILLLLAGLWMLPVQADSQRIVVSPNPQMAYYDVQRGDTLSGIAQRILPSRPTWRSQLMQRLVAINPDAFVSGDPDRLKANVRLWLPDEFSGIHRGKRPAHAQVEQFSWGTITRPVRQ